MGRLDEWTRVNLVVAAGDDGDASLRTVQDREAEAVSERLVSLLMTAKPGDGGGDASGIGGVTFRVGWVEKGGYGRGVGDARCLEVKGTVEGGDEDPALSVFDLVPFLVGLQDGGEDVVAETFEVGGQEQAGQAGAEGRDVLEQDGGGHSFPDDADHRKEQVAGVAELGLSPEALLGPPKGGVAGAGNPTDEDVECRTRGGRRPRPPGYRPG